MKQTFLTLSTFISIVFFMNSCTDTTTTEKSFTGGAYVINEGNFGSSNATISYIKSDGTVENNIFSSQNDGLILGDALQDICIYNGKAYLVINNSNKIAVVNSTTLKVETFITITSPRYMIIHNDKGYVTQWNNFSGNCQVKVLNLTTNAIEDSITVGKLPEQMIVAGNNLVVGNQGDTTIHIVDLTTNAVSNIGNVTNPRFVKKSTSGEIWILYQGAFPWPGPASSGGFIVLNSTASTIVKTIPFSSSSNPSQLATDGVDFYYELSGSIYKINQSATTEPGSSYYTSPASSVYGLNYANNMLYISDAKNFAMNGMVYRYNTSTNTLVDSVQVGINPNGVVFN